MTAAPPGRPPGRPRQQTSRTLLQCYLRPKDLIRLRKLADREDQPMAAIVRELILRHLDQEKL